MENITIKLFLASSITEFELERYKLSDFINSLNQIYHDRGIFFKLWKCEDHSKALASGRKQEEYNQKIRESEYFYTLIGTGAGEYTLEEFEVALEHFRQCESPKIYTYFRNLPEGEPPEQSRETFMERLDKGLGHYYSMFSHLDTVKLNLLIELMEHPKIHSKMEVKDGEVLLNGTMLLTTENIPIYSKNNGLQQLWEEKARLDEAHADLRREIIAHPENDEVFEKLAEISRQRKELGDKIRQAEADVLRLYSSVIQMDHSGKPVTWRMKKARQLLNTGEYDAVLDLLRDEDREKELEQGELLVQSGRLIEQSGMERIVGYISEDRLKIQTLLSLGLNQERLSEINSRYEKCVKLAVKHQLELDVLYEYAEFLCDQRQFSKALEIAERLNTLYSSHPAEQAHIAKLKNLFGLISLATAEVTLGEKHLKDAIELWHQLASENPDTYENKLAASYNNLACLYQRQNRLKDAEDLYNKAIEIEERLARKNPDAYEGNLVSTYQNMARFYWQQNRLEEAEDLYNNAIEISERLVRSNPDAYERDLASAYDGLADLYLIQNRLEEAKSLCKKAIKIRERLARKEPTAYEGNPANTHINLAKLYEYQNLLDEAETLYNKAIEILKLFTNRNPDAYVRDLTLAYNGLAYLYGQQNRLKDAEDLYNKAIEIRERLARKNPDAYEGDLAIFYNNLAALYSNNNNKQSAREVIKKAVELADRISEKNQSLNIYLQANIYYGFADLHADLPKRRKDSEIYCQKALRLYEQLSYENPGAYNDKMDGLKRLLNRIRSTPAHPKKKKRK